MAAHLAERFASDARALRARAEALGRSTGRGAPRPAGPSAESTERMAAACDRVEALFAGAETDDAVRALLPTVEAMARDARTSEETYVYGGAVARLTQALGGGADDGGGDDDDAEDDDAEDDDA